MAKKIALTQLSSCWGCDQALIDLHLGLLDVLPALEIVYWPTVVDYKLKDLEAMDVTRYTSALLKVVAEPKRIPTY